MKMKIIEIIYNLSPGGAERFVVDLSNQLSELNDVSLFTLKDDSDLRNVFYKSELSSKVKYKNLKIPSGYSLRSIFKLYNIIKNEKADVIHFHISDIIIYFILVIVFNRKCLYFQTQHTDVGVAESTYDKWFLIRRYLYKKKLVNTCAISQYNQKTLASTFALKSPKIIVNGRAKVELNDNSILVYDEICSYKRTKETICFLHIGRNAKVKNQNLLIEAFNIFSKDNDAILMIIGEGFDGLKGEELRKKSNSSVYYLGKKTNVCDYLNYSDAFCLSSFYEGMPITLIEAFSQGCIPISTPVSGSVDYIIDGETGFITEDFSIESYLNALFRFRDNRYKITKQTLYAVYDKNFSITECADKYMDWFLECSK